MSMTLEQGVQGDAVLLPGSGGSPVPFPPSHWLLAGGMHRVPEELLMSVKGHTPGKLWRIVEEKNYGAADPINHYTRRHCLSLSS